MVDGFTANTETIRASAKELAAASDEWAAAIWQADGAEMTDGTLGFLGDKLDFVKTYNSAKETLVSRAGKGVESLNTANEQLNFVADDYDGKDTSAGHTFRRLRPETRRRSRT